MEGKIDYNKDSGTPQNITCFLFHAPFNTYCSLPLSCLQTTVTLPKEKSQNVTHTHILRRRWQRHQEKKQMMMIPAAISTYFLILVRNLSFFCLVLLLFYCFLVIMDFRSQLCLLQSLCFSEMGFLFFTRLLKKGFFESFILLLVLSW